MKNASKIPAKIIGLNQLSNAFSMILCDSTTSSNVEMTKKNKIKTNNEFNYEPQLPNSLSKLIIIQKLYEGIFNI